MIIWIDMLAGDDAKTASVAAKIFQHEHVIQFHDPNKLMGKAVAKSLRAHNAIAWDIYLFFEKGSKWLEHFPTPLDWAHQLEDPRASPGHYAWGDDLHVRLQTIVNDLIEI